jgi:hypothetical protein
MKKILLILGVVVVLAGGYGYYLYTKPVSGLMNVDPDFSLSSDSLYSYFDTNEEAANAKYLGKIIEVKGKVREFSIGDSGEVSVILSTGNPMFSVNCGMNKEQEIDYKSYKVGDTIKVKGECSGISMDVVMTRGVIVK